MREHRRLRSLAAGMACLTGLAFMVQPGLATAAPVADKGPSVAGAASSSAFSSAIVADPVCEAALRAAGEVGTCAARADVSVGAATTVGANGITKNAGLVAPDGTTLALAAATTTIWTRTWEQTRHGLYYVNWWEKHIGRIFFDNAGHVWSTTSRAGYLGYHACGLGGGVGYSIAITQCSTERRFDLSRPAVSEWDRYQVHVVYKGIPIYASHSMHANADDNGTITFP